MATERVHAALMATFTEPNPQMRKEAEAFVMEVSQQMGAVKAFFEICVAEHVAPPVRQAAAVRLRQLLSCREDWNSTEMCKRVSEVEKQLLRGNLLNAIVVCPKQVQTQLLIITEWIARWDFPERWQGLGPELGALLTSGDNAKILAALATLRKMVKRYEYVEGDSRQGDIDNIAVTFFPLLLQIFEAANNLAPTQETHVAEVQKLCLKIFYSCNIRSVAGPIAADADACNRWMECIMHALQQPAPADQSPAHLCWKAKKWAATIVDRLLSSYNRKVSNKSTKHAFAMLFQGKYAGAFISVGVRLLSQARAMNMPGKVVCRFISIVQAGVTSKKCFSLVAKDLDEILQGVLFKYMCWSNEEQELWTDNPEEYVRKTHSIGSFDLMDPAVFAVQLMHECMKQAHDGQLVFRFFNFLLAVLQKTASQAADAEAMKERYGVYQTLSALKPILLKKSGSARWNEIRAQLTGQMEELLVAHVFPGFESPFGFIRASSMYVVSQYGGMDWKSHENFRRALMANIAMMKDPELPVRIHAGSVVQKLVHRKGAREVVLPVLGQIVETTFSLMKEIDSDVLVQTLEIVIENYGEDMESQAVQICQALINHFQGVTREFIGMQKSEDDLGQFNNELMDAISAGEQCVSAISSLVLALKEKPHLVTQLQVTCMPMLTALCEMQYYEFFDRTVELIVVIMVYSNAIHPEFWRLFDLLHVAFTTFAQDNIEKALAIYDNFITKDTKVFLSDLSRVEKVGALCAFVLEYRESELENRISLQERKVAPKLMEVLLQSCKVFSSVLDPYVPKFYDACMKCYSSPKCPTSLRQKLCNVFLTGIWYNTPLTLSYLESKNATGHVFEAVFNLLQSYVKIYDMKVLSIGFTTILEYGVANSLPPYFTDEKKMAMAQVSFETAMKRCTLVKENDDLEAEEDEETDESDDDNLMGMLGELGDDDDDDDAGLGKMGVMGNQCGEFDYNKLLQQAQEHAEDEYSEDEDGCVWSVIDEVNEVGIIMDYLKKLQAAQPAAWQHFVSKVSKDMLDGAEAARQFSEKKVQKAIEDNQAFSAQTMSM
eukprot:TRINITY_DN789_c7_g1_i2.p1 TRINITY_DN789_c7_g1~~TRINITY_DN789_c7_g1_i2.p1  ORF type:complete len:1058 (+),score=427.19 TRINITY_DN789_c7_g1_i2:115-3288(+)